MKAKVQAVVRTNPRISLNKLGEYLVAPPLRRRRILHDQKHPQDFIAARYTEAENVIIDFIVDGTGNTSILDEALIRIDSKKTTTEWEEQTKVLNYGAVEAFYEICDQFTFSKSRLTKCGKNDQVYLEIEGVQISLRPDIRIETRKGKYERVGALKLYLSKTNPLSKLSGEYAAALLSDYLKNSGHADDVDGKSCLIVDVYNNAIYSAPISYKQRMADITAACQEIAALWSTL